MKKLHLSLAGIIFLFLLFSCNNKDLGTNDTTLEKNLLNPKGGVISIIAANPEITYRSKVTSGKGKNSATYKTIGVMDADGTNQTNVYIANTTSVLVSDPTWSPDGNSISWIKQENAYAGPCEIIAADITINSNGVPVAGNYRTITTVPYESPNYYETYNQAWCSLEETAKIAFVVSGSTGFSFLYTVSTSGGDWDMLSYICDEIPGPDGAGFYSQVCWSPDDSKIAFIHHSSGGDKILIFDNQTRTITDEIPTPTGFLNYGPLDWSRNGMNSLAVTTYSADGEFIYYVTPPTNGTTPTTNRVSGRFSSWSPNNSSLMFVSYGKNAGLKKMIPFTSTVTTLSSSFSGFDINWKK